MTVEQVGDCLPPRPPKDRGPGPAEVAYPRVSGCVPTHVTQRDYGSVPGVPETRPYPPGVTLGGTSLPGNRGPGGTRRSPGLSVHDVVGNHDAPRGVVSLPSVARLRQEGRRFLREVDQRWVATRVSEPREGLAGIRDPSRPTSCPSHSEVRPSVLRLCPGETTVGGTHVRSLYRPRVDRWDPLRPP